MFKEAPRAQLSRRGPPEEVTSSLNAVELLDGGHESAHAHAVATDRAHHFLGPVVHRVELANLVVEANALKEGTDVLSAARELEIVFGNAKLCEGRGEQKVNGLGLISIVLKAVWVKEVILRCNLRLSAFP